MFRKIQEGLKSVHEIQTLIQEIDTSCKKTVENIRTNGVILDEYNKLSQKDKQPSI